MNKEELELYVKKSCENILKQLAENPKEMFDLLELQDKYNNLLKEKIELKRQIKKQKEVNDKAVEFINENKDKYYQDWGQDDSDVDTYLNEYEIKELLDILKEGKNE